MSDQIQILDFWLIWQSLMSNTVTCIGVISTIIALWKYRYNVSKTNRYAIILALLIWLLLGLCPVDWGIYSDRTNYARLFLKYKNGDLGDIRGYESGFRFVNLVLSRFLDLEQYFFTMAGIYMFNYYYAIKKFCKKNNYWMLIAVIMSMGFIAYNVNTMRAGLAISFIVLGLAMYPSKTKMAICMLIAYSLHASTIIPSSIIVICYLFDKTALYYKIWILSIPISFVAGYYFNDIFASLGEDSRSDYLTTQDDSSYNVGFRIDFIIYSLLPMAIGAYYIFKVKVKDKLYRLIYNSYLLTNLFWILVIRADYSDRFAYLSWFLIPFILTYPLLTQKLNIRENIWLGSILCGETIFGLLF